ncbi:MAG: ABC transporter substrate-binding protein [Methanoregulaceae archaeon]|nr:ABC transporter substrate-binding protein [Methanoregulaceae archaeon]
MNSRIIASLCLFAIAALLVAGCTQPPAKSNLTEIRIGYQPSTHQVAEMIAMDKGWFKQDLAPYGITNISDYLFPSGPPEMQAMLANQLDVAYVGAAPVLTAVATGLDAKIVAGVNTQGSDLVIRTGLNYTGPRSLIGLKIATFQPGSIQDTILRDWLKNNGVDPEKDVGILGMGPGDAVTAITAGKVDAVFLPHPSPSVIEANGKGKIIVHSGEMYPDHTCCVLVASGKLIREHPDIVTQIVKTHIRASEFAANKSNLDETAGIYARKNSANVDEIRKSLQEWDGTFVTDPNVIIKSVLDYAKIQYELGYIKTPLTQDQLFDLSFYQKAKSS